MLRTNQYPSPSAGSLELCSARDSITAVPGVIVPVRLECRNFQLRGVPQAERWAFEELSLYKNEGLPGSAKSSHGAGLRAEMLRAALDPEVAGDRTVQAGSDGPSWTWPCASARTCRTSS